MPSLRELLRAVHDDTRFSPTIYALLEALVEAVEPEDTCGECEFCTTDVAGCNYERTHKGPWPVSPDSKACKAFRRRKPEDTELAEVKAEIERLRKERDELEKAHDFLGCYADSLKADAKLGNSVRAIQKEVDDDEA